MDSAYERLSVGKLWDQIQPRGERQDPAQREEWNAAKAQFVKRWKKLQKGDRTPAQQAFFDMCRAKLEPNLEVEVRHTQSHTFTAHTHHTHTQVYFTMGGRRDGLVGSVSVPLCDLQDGLMHDLWLNLRPNAKWSQQLGMWGSVHVVIQKSKKPHVRVSCGVVGRVVCCVCVVSCCVCDIANIAGACAVCSWEC